MKNKLAKEMSRGIWEQGAMYQTECYMYFATEPDGFLVLIPEDAMILFLRYHEKVSNALVFFLVDRQQIAYIHDSKDLALKFVSSPTTIERKSRA